MLGLGSSDKASVPCKLYPAQQRLSSPLGKLAGKRTNPWKGNCCPQRVRAGSAGSVSSAGHTQLARTQQRTAGVTAELRPAPRHGAAPRHRGAARPVLVPSPSLPQPHVPWPGAIGSFGTSQGRDREQLRHGSAFQGCKARPQSHKLHPGPIKPIPSSVKPVLVPC